MGGGLPLGCVQDRLDGALDLSSLFQAPAAEALGLVHACKAVADGWRTHYMATREKIEAAGHHARWEFSKQLLFERTNYAAEVRSSARGSSASARTASCRGAASLSESVQPACF
jgi:hypothetical protein